MSVSRHTQRSKPPYTLGDGKLEVHCDCAGSYRIVDEYERTVALVKCDRRDTKDNERGLRIANAIVAALNTTSSVFLVIEEHPDYERDVVVYRTREQADTHVAALRVEYAKQGTELTQEAESLWVGDDGDVSVEILEKEVQS